MKEGGSNEENQMADDRESIERELKIGYRRGTCFGGTLAIFGALLIIGEIVRNFVGIWHNKEHSFSSEKIHMTSFDISKTRTNLNDDHAFKFVFGLGNLDEGFDILNNEYVEFVGYNMFYDGEFESLNETY